MPAPAALHPSALSLSHPTALSLSQEGLDLSHEFGDEDYDPRWRKEGRRHMLMVPAPPLCHAMALCRPRTRRMSEAQSVTRHMGDTRAGSPRCICAYSALRIRILVPPRHPL